MLTAAPIKRKPLHVLGYPGMTDFTTIFIASELNSDEYRTVLRHEQAHIWSGHNWRTPAKVDHKVWRIACELEIARNIYDAEDLECIAAPRSRLAGGYCTDTIPTLPASLMIAEDIYEWLLANPEAFPKVTIMICQCESKEEREASKDGGQQGQAESGEGEGEAGEDKEGESPDRGELISEVVEKLNEMDRSARSKAAAQAAYKTILTRKPSLTEALDYVLRYRVIREPSYRRPSRRHDESIVLKGRISTPRPPLVEVFVDRSGSFDSSKTAAAAEHLQSILTRYGASLQCDTWFFGNGTLSPTDIPGGGDTPYPLIAQHLLRTVPKVAIILTDNDSVGDIGERPKVEVLCIPIGCSSTQVAAAFGGRDVVTS